MTGHSIRLDTLLIFFVALFCMLITSGCRLTSAGFVALTKAGIPDVEAIPISDVDKIETNAVINVVLKDNIKKQRFPVAI